MSAAGMSFTTVFQNLTAAKFSDSRRLAESKPLENQVPLVAGRTASFLIYISNMCRMLICSEPAFLPTSLFATDFPIQSGYNFLDGRGGDDCCVSGQRIPVQRFDRLSSGAGGGTAGGNSPAPRTLCLLWPAGRALCSSRFPARLRLSGGCAG